MRPSGGLFEQIAGCPLDSHDYDGRTALHISAGKGDIDLVRFLAANSNVNPVDIFNNTPLRSALDSMQEETARFLYANGGKLNDNEVEIACKLCYFAYANMKGFRRFQNFKNQCLLLRRDSALGTYSSND